MTEVKTKVNWFEWFKLFLPLALGWLPFASGWTWIKDRPIYIAWAVLFGLICTLVGAGVLLWRGSANWQRWARAGATGVIVAAVALGAWAAIKAPGVIPKCGCYKNTFFWRRNAQPPPQRRFTILLPKIRADTTNKTVGEHLTAGFERQLRGLNQQVKSDGIMAVEMQFLALPQELPANDSKGEERMKKYLACLHQGDYILQGSYDDQGTGKIVINPADSSPDKLPESQKAGKLNIQADKLPSSGGALPTNQQMMEALADYLTNVLYGLALFQIGEGQSEADQVQDAMAFYNESERLLEDAQAKAKNYDDLAKLLSPIYKRTNLVARAYSVFVLGNVRFRLDKFDRAIACYDEVIGLLKPESSGGDRNLLTGTLYNRGIARYFQALKWQNDGSHQEALQSYQQAIGDLRAVVPQRGQISNAAYAVNLVSYRAEIMKGDYDKADAAFEAAKQILATPPKPLNRLPYLLDDYGDALLDELDNNHSLAGPVRDQLVDRTIRAYRDTILLKPEWKAESHYSIAIAYWNTAQCNQCRGNCAAVCQELKAVVESGQMLSDYTKSNAASISRNCRCNSQ